MAAPTIRFRPILDISSLYDTGLSNVAVNDSGDLANASSSGVRLGWGISGSHSWRHTLVGLDYRGSFTKYSRSISTGLDQSFLLGIQQRVTRHINFSLSESVGIFTRDFGLAGLAQTVPFDPSQSYVPTTDFFDNRTIYSTTQARVTLQRTARLSFSFGGDAFLNLRHSAALSNAVGSAASGDVQYRLSRSTTIGAVYGFSRYSFSRVSGSTDVHSLAGSYSVRPTRRLEFTMTAGAARVESKFLQTTALDPVLTQLLGISQTVQVVYSKSYHPHVAARLSRTFSTGVFYVSGGESVTPGNGLFLTSYMKSAMVGYSYTGLRRWSLTSQAGYTRSDADGDITGAYGGATATWSVARSLGRTAHFTATYSLRRYESPDYNRYNRLINSATVGIGFAPGDIPLRIW